MVMFDCIGYAVRMVAISVWYRMSLDMEYVYMSNLECVED